MADGYISQIKTPDNKTYLLKDGESVHRNSELLTTNPFSPFSLTGPYISKIDNAFYAADKRWTVTGTNISSIPPLFDGNYESNGTISAGKTATITIDFDPNHNNSAYFPGYPYGYILISFYYTSGPSSVSARVYCNYNAHGIGWHNIAFSPINDNDSTHITYRSEHQGSYNISQLEVTITAGSSDVRVTQIEMHLDRPSSALTPFLSKYNAETLYYDLTAPKFIGSLQGNANTATTATNLANNPSIQTSGTTQITITAGGKTSSAYTVPYATNANIATILTSTAKSTEADCMPSTKDNVQFFRTNSDSSGLQNDGHIIGFTWSDATKYGAQIFIDTDPTYKIALRQRDSGGTWQTWKNILTSNTTSAGANNTATLNWNTTYTIAKIDGTDIKFTTMAKPSYSYSDISSRPTSIKLTGAVTGSVTLSNGENSIATTVNHNHNSSYLTAVEYDTTNKKIYYTKNGSNTDVVTVATLRTDMGLSNAMHFIGITSTTLSDGSTTSTLTAKSTNSLSKTTGFVDGDVVMDGDQLREYVWSGSAWRLLGITTSTAYTQPASTATNTWIAQVSQGTDGKITATTGSLNTSGTWSGNATTATTATNLANNPSIQTASNSNQITITAGGKTSSAYTVPYATYAGSATSATTATYIKCTDTRSTALNPTDLNAASGVRFDFKAKGTISLTATDPYAGVMSFRPYASGSDWSGGNAHQIAFNSEGLHWRNGGASWGNWYQILDSNNTSAANTNGAVISVARNTDTKIATINGVDIKIKIPASDNTWRPIGTGADDAAAGNHTHTLSIAEDTSTNALTLAYGKKYKLTAGGSTYIFTMPASDNTNTATAADNILDGSNSGTEITYAPYTTQQSKLSFDTSSTNPTRTDRLNLNGYLYATKYFSSLTPSSQIDGQRYQNGALNIAEYSNTGSYNPWIRATNTWASGAESAKVGRWFSFGTLGTSFYLMGSASTRTENSYDHALRYDTSSGKLYCDSTEVSLSGHTHNESNITWSNGTLYTIGDDVYIGDINQAGHLGLKSKQAGNTGLAFIKQATANDTAISAPSGTTIGKITWDGTKFSITSTTAVDASISGNAATANSAGKWTTARTLTIGSTGKTVDGSGNVSWSLAEIGAAASGHEHDYIGNSRYIAYTTDGHYEGSGTVTGYIKIRIPKTKSATMLSFDVDIYNYSGDTSTRYHIAGYNYTDASWNNTTAYCIAPLSNAKANLTVRFLSNGNDEMYVTIGETDTSWSYPKVNVHNIVMGHSGNSLANWASGWTITITNTAFTSSQIKVTKTNTNIAYVSTTVGTSTLAWNEEKTLYTIGGAVIKAKLPAMPTYSDIGAAAADHGTHVTTATVQSALGISSSGSGSKALTEKGTFVTFGTSNLTIGTTSSTAMAGNTTVTNVAISADTTTNKNYALVFGTTPSDGTSPTAAKTESLQKNSAKFYVNPSTGNLQATTFNGYTLAAASAKAVVTSIDSSASLPTSNAVKTFIEGKGYVTSSGVTSITLKAGAGITLDTDNTAITSTGTRTISINGMNTSNGSTTKWLNQKGGWSTPSASDVGALSSSTTVTNVAISADITTNKNYAVVFGTTPSDGTQPTAAKTEGLQKNISKFYFNPYEGNLNATSFSVDESVTLKYNTTDSALEFVFG